VTQAVTFSTVWITDATKCFATAKSISESDQGVIKEQIAGLYPGHKVDTLMASLTCKEFFDEFSRSLAF
jgi:hypothetical protein